MTHLLFLHVLKKLDLNFQLTETSLTVLHATLSKGFDEDRRQKELIENVKEILAIHNLSESDTLVAVN